MNAFDVADLKRRLGARPADGRSGGAAYSIFADVNGDGANDALDAAAIKQRLISRLPADVAMPAATGAPDAVFPGRRATEDLRASANVLG